MITAQTLMNWIDLFWIPVALVTMEKGKKIKTCLFILGCSLLLRLQVEFLQQIGYPQGFTGWIETPVFTRGLITYSCFIAFFLIIAHFSKGGDKHVHIAASITILIAAFCLSTVIMVV